MNLICIMFDISLLFLNKKCDPLYFMLSLIFHDEWYCIECQDNDRIWYLFEILL